MIVASKKGKARGGFTMRAYLPGVPSASTGECVADDPF